MEGGGRIPSLNDFLENGIFIPDDLSPQIAQMCLVRDPGLVDG